MYNQIRGKMRKHEINNRVKRSRIAFKQRDFSGSENFYTVFSLFGHYCQKEDFRKKESCSVWIDSDTMSVSYSHRTMPS